MDADLVRPFHRILDWIFRRAQVDAFPVDMVEAGIQSKRLARSGRTAD